MYTNEFIKEKDLEVGGVYIDKQGTITILLGTSKNGEFVFFDVVALCLKFCSWDYSTGKARQEFSIRDGNLALNIVQSYIKALMNKPFNGNELRILRGVPKLCAKLSIINKKDIELWVAKSRLLGGNEIPTINTAYEKLIKRIEYVKSKDLEVGRLYYTGADSWRSTYCFLGRADGKYMWCFIGNDDLFAKNPEGYVMHCDASNISVTKVNKKVRVLSSGKLAGFKANFSPQCLNYLKNKCDYFEDRRNYYY